MNTLHRAKNIQTAPLGEELLMLNVDRGLYHSLTPVAARIWQLLEQTTTESSLVSTLTQEFEVSADVCATQVREFLAQLHERKLISQVA